MSQVISSLEMRTCLDLQRSKTYVYLRTSLSSIKVNASQRLQVIASTRKLWPNEVVSVWPGPKARMLRLRLARA